MMTSMGWDFGRVFCAHKGEQGWLGLPDRAAVAFHDAGMGAQRPARRRPGGRITISRSEIRAPTPRPEYGARRLPRLRLFPRAEVGICARRRSNFLLRRQEKVTKEKATPLSVSPALRCGAACGARAGRGPRKLAPLCCAQTARGPDPPGSALLGTDRGARRRANILSGHRCAWPSGTRRDRRGAGMGLTPKPAQRRPGGRITISRSGTRALTPRPEYGAQHLRRAVALGGGAAIPSIIRFALCLSQVVIQVFYASSACQSCVTRYQKNTSLPKPVAQMPGPRLT